jgi:hypothetical protein
MHQLLMRDISRHALQPQLSRQRIHPDLALLQHPSLETSSAHHPEILQPGSRPARYDSFLEDEALSTDASG